MIIEKLSKHHNIKNFDCGNKILNEFIKKYAYQIKNRRYLITERPKGVFRKDNLFQI